MVITGNATKSTNWTKDVKEDDSFCEDSRNTDLVIALMGPTGAGKSTFINTFMNKTVAVVGDGLESETAQVNHFFFNDPKYPGRRIVLIDTPGFNDTYVDDTEILRRIAIWLVRSYNADMKLSGLIYLHSIHDNRMNGSARKNLELFQQLCGEKASEKIVLATTMWSEIRNPRIGERREQQLKDGFWKDMLAHGSNMARFKATRSSARDIVHSLLAQNHFSPIQIQRELGDQNKSIPETAAALALSRAQEPPNLPPRTVSNGPGLSSKKASWKKSIKKAFMDTDRVIVVLGQSGSGKSTFINILMGKHVASVGHGLDPETTYMQHFTFADPDLPERRIVVVDTPGFDDALMNEQEALNHIAVWLAESYNGDMKLAGLIYLQDITQTRNFKRISRDTALELCGQQAYKKLIFATTKWSYVPLSVGENRERQLKSQCFRDMLDQGATIIRFVDSQLSARGIVHNLLAKNDDNFLRIQRELVDRGETPEKSSYLVAPVTLGGGGRC